MRQVKKENQKKWVENQIGKGMLEGCDETVFSFYYRAMHDYKMDFYTADRYAWLNTLFGYDVGAERAKTIDNWLYEHDSDVMDLGASDKTWIQELSSQLELKFDFAKWAEKTPNAVKYVW